MPNGNGKNWAKPIVVGVVVLVIFGWIAWVSTTAIEARVSKDRIQHIADDVKKIMTDVEYIKKFFK